MGTAERSGWRLRVALVLASSLIATAGLPALPASARAGPVAAEHVRSGSSLDNVSVSPVPAAAGNVGTPGRASTPLLDALVVIHPMAGVALVPDHAAALGQAGVRSLAHSPSRERSPPQAL